MISEKLQHIAARIDSMELRERALMLITGVVVLFFLFDAFGLQPAFERQERSKLDIADWELQLQVLHERSGLLSGRADNDPMQQRDRLQAELAGLDNRLHKQLEGLLEPEQAVRVLEQVLAQEQNLKLRKVDAVSRPLTGPEFGEVDSEPVTGIGRYELQLQLEGSYLGTLRYLRALEALPWKFFWEAMDFEVVEYPNARVTLDIYTLGLFDGWLVR